MARIGGEPSKVNATDENDRDTDSDTEMDEELLKLYQQRPSSLRVSESGKKERDPEYHCLMEKLRRRQSNLALKKLRQSLLHPPAKNSLIHTLDMAVTEIKGLKAKYAQQRFECGRLQHQQAVLQNRLNYLRAEITARGKCVATSTTLVCGIQNSTAPTPSRPRSLSLLQPALVVSPIRGHVQVSEGPCGSSQQLDGGIRTLTVPTPVPPTSQWLVSPSFVPSPSPLLLSSPILNSPLPLTLSPQHTAQGIRAVAMVPPFPGGIFPSLCGISPSLSGISPSLSGISASRTGISLSLSGLSPSRTGIPPSLSGLSLSHTGISLSPRGIPSSLNGISRRLQPYTPYLINGQLSSPIAALEQNHLLPSTVQGHSTVTSRSDVT